MLIFKKRRFSVLLFILIIEVPLFIYIHKSPPIIILETVFKKYHTWRKVIPINEKMGNILIGLVSMPNFTRQNNTFNTWIKKLDKITNHKAIFLSQSKVPIEGVNTLVINYTLPSYINPELKADYDRGYKRVAGAYYFLKETNFDWYWSATDDIVIDVEGIDQMLFDLRKKYDPKKDIVLKGHLFYQPAYKETYLQGGVGYLFSRRAIEIFIKGYAKEYLDTMVLIDDIHSISIIKYLNLTFSDVKFGYFYGNFINRKYFTPNFPDFVDTKCKDIKKIAKYHSNVPIVSYPIKDLICLHIATHIDSSFNSITIKQMMEYIMKAKENYNNLYYWEDGVTADFCWGKPYISSGRYYYNDVYI